MEIDHPNLFIEINDTNYIFVAGTYDENQNLKVIEKIITPSAGIDKSKFISIDQAAEEIKKNVAIIEKNLKNETFIESFSIKKIYPNTLKIIIVEKEPIAVLQNKKKKFYISNKGDFLDFQYMERYRDLPTVFGNGKFFYSLYQDLQSIKFPLETIKSFYFFESGRWDLAMHDDKMIKLPTKDYLVSLKNYMESRNNSNFNNYRIFDYRIKDQLILN